MPYEENAKSKPSGVFASAAAVLWLCAQMLCFLGSRGGQRNVPCDRLSNADAAPGKLGLSTWVLGCFIARTESTNVSSSTCQISGAVVRAATERLHETIDT